LFFAVSELPATVPVALALIVVELGNRVRLGGAHGNRIRLRALTRSAPRYQETASRARAVTTGQHPAGRARSGPG
jgi:hypothetical protein